MFHVTVVKTTLSTKKEDRSKRVAPIVVSSSCRRCAESTLHRLRSDIHCQYSKSI